MMLRQGQVNYQNEVLNDKVVHREEKPIKEDDSFAFDPDIPAIQRFIHFKATVIGRDLNVNEDIMGNDTNTS